MGQLAYIQFVGGQGGQVDPGYGQPAPPPGAVTLPVFPFDPTIDNSLPTQPGHPSQGLPGGAGRPDQGLPSHGHADNSLPGPGKRYVVKWLACHGLILVPDNSLPGQSGRPDQSLPGSQPGLDNTLPGGPPVRPDQGLPPHAQPKK